MESGEVLENISNQKVNMKYILIIMTNNNLFITVSVN